MNYQVFEKNLLIAVAVTAGGGISPHAGRALIWQVYSASSPESFELAWTVNLTELGSLHEWHVRGDGNRHPVHSADIAIAGNAGDGVKRRLAERNTQLITSAVDNPQEAVALYMANSLPVALERGDEDYFDPELRKLKERNH